MQKEELMCRRTVERERERERKTERDRERETVRNRERQRETERDREKQRERNRERESGRKRSEEMCRYLIQKRRFANSDKLRVFKAFRAQVSLSAQV